MTNSPTAIVDDYLVGYSDGLKVIVDAAENVIIAYGMGWDMDGVIEQLRASLPNDSVCWSGPTTPTTPTPQQIDRAAWAWRNDKSRETDGSDDAYFRHNWQALPGLRAYVDREVEKRHG